MIRIIFGKQVTETNIIQALHLDYLSYDEEYHLKPETCFSYHRKNPNIYLMALDEKQGHVVGYINFSPVSRKMYKMLCTGSYFDTIIDEKDIEVYIPGNNYYGYLSSIVVHPDYRKRGIARQLLSELDRFIAWLAVDSDIHFIELVADAVSDVGCYILRRVGFRQKIESMHGTKIMIMDPFSEDIEKTVYNNMWMQAY